MAVVFISPKQRQKMFFIGITLMFLIFLGVISITIMLSKPDTVPTVLVFNKPKVSIDMSVFDSDQFMHLQPLFEMDIQFSYKATTKNNRETIGFISAVSEEEARKSLEARNLRVTELKEVEIGRDNPFTPYYTTPLPR